MPTVLRHQIIQVIPLSHIQLIQMVNCIEIMVGRSTLAKHVMDLLLTLRKIRKVKRNLNISRNWRINFQYPTLVHPHIPELISYINESRWNWKPCSDRFPFISVVTVIKMYHPIYIHDISTFFSSYISLYIAVKRDWIVSLRVWPKKPRYVAFSRLLSNILLRRHKHSSGGLPRSQKNHMISPIYAAYF